MLTKSGTEHGEQAALFCWASSPEVRAKYPELEWMFAIPNGGLRNKASAGMLKAEGVKAGVADVMLPVTCHYFAGLFIEMKRANGVPSDVKPHQTKFADFVKAQGYVHAVAFGWQQAVRAIENYLGPRDEAAPVDPKAWAKL
jgi:hypothetical protein